jgi:hypothetical protein
MASLFNSDRELVDPAFVALLVVETLVVLVVVLA